MPSPSQSPEAIASESEEPSGAVVFAHAGAGAAVVGGTVVSGGTVVGAVVVLPATVVVSPTVVVAARVVVLSLELPELDDELHPASRPAKAKDAAAARARAVDRWATRNVGHDRSPQLRP